MRIGRPFLACIAVLQLGDKHADEAAQGHDGAYSLIGNLLDVFHVDVEAGVLRRGRSLGDLLGFGFGGFHKDVIKCTVGGRTLAVLGVKLLIES